MKAWMSSNFGKFATELLPLIDVRIEFLFNILKTNRRIKTKFCKHIIIDKMYFGFFLLLFLFNVPVNNFSVMLRLLWYCKSLFFTNFQQSYGP